MRQLGRWSAVVMAGAVTVIYSAVAERLAMLRDLVRPEVFGPADTADAVFEEDTAPVFYQKRA